MEAGDDSVGSRPCPIRITSAAHVEVTVQGGQFKTYDAIKAIYCVCIKLPGLPVVPPTCRRQQNASLVAVVLPKRRWGLGIEEESTINTTKLRIFRATCI